MPASMVPKITLTIIATKIKAILFWDSKKVEHAGQGQLSKQIVVKYYTT